MIQNKRQVKRLHPTMEKRKNQNIGYGKTKERYQD